jgi:uncharacterized protein YndB with AHSA1/START domain
MHIVSSDIIAAPPEAVFDAAADPQTQLSWDAGNLLAVEKLTPGALARGARYRGRFKGMGTVEYEFAEFDRPQRFAHRTQVPFGTMGHRLTFEPAAEGTRLTQEGWLEPNLVGRLMTPLIGRMLRRRLPTVARELGEYLASQRPL